MISEIVFKLSKDKEYFRRLILIAFPIVIQNLITSSLNILDTIMVGRIGETAIASVGIGNQVFLFFNIISMGVSSGCGIFISQYWGQKDTKNIRRVFGIGLITASLVAILFSLVIVIFPREVIGIFNKESDVLIQGSSYIRIVGISYLFTALTFCISTGSRSLEITKPPMVVSIIALIINGTLNYIFIFGKLGFPAMGVTGAAIATLIARAIEFSLIFGYVFKTNDYLFGNIRDLFDLSKSFVFKVLVVVRDVVLNEILWGLAAVMYSVIYGKIGSGALAAVQIYNMVQTFFMVLAFGLATSSCVMVGKELGMGKFDRARDFGNYSLILSGTIGLIMSLLVVITAPQIVKVFNISDGVRHDAKLILYVAALIFVVKSINIVMILGTLRGGGDAKYALRIESITMWFIGLPMALIGTFVFKFPIYIVIAMTFAEEVVKCILCVKRLFSEKWMNRLAD